MHLKKTLALTLGLLFSLGAHAETYRWDTVAMGGGGFVSGIVPSKSERGVVYARTDVGGAYRWDGQTGRWIPLTDWISESDMGLLGIESIAIDPRNAGTVYMLAGTPYFSNGKTAILRSTDYGQHFDVVDVTAQFKTNGNGMGRSNGERLQVDPGSSNVLYAGTRANGLFKSVDSGATWAHVDGLNVNTTPNGNGISFVLPDPASVSGGVAKRIFVGVSRYGSVGPNLYMSKDGGATFAPVAGSPTGLMPQRAVITAKGRLYLTYANGAGPHAQGSDAMDSGQVWEYNMVGGAWTNITPAGMTSAFAGISVDPGNPKHLIASTTNMYRLQQKQPASWGDHIFTSYDAGRSWVDLMQGNMTIDPNGIDWVRYSSIHWAGDVQFDPFDPKTAWVISGNGIFKNTNLDDTANSTWKFDVHGLEETGPYAGESIASGPFVATVGDYDGFINSDPAQYGTRMTPSMGGNTGLAIAALAPRFMARVASSLYTSTDMGVTWQKAPTINGQNGKVALSSDGYALLHSPEGSATTYRSTDFGANWTPVSGLSVKDAVPVADKVNPNKFYVYDKNGGAMYVSTDGGASFSARANLPSGGASLVRATPNLEGDVWTCLESQGLSHSTDSGATFTRIGAVSSCSAIGLGKEAPNTSYPTLYIWGAVGLTRGLLRSTDMGAHWDRVNDDTHQYGSPAIGWVNGDMNTYGTVYMSSNGRGVVYGQIDPNGDVQVVPQVPVKPAPTAVCKYELSNVWWGGGIATVSVTNQGKDTLHGWQVSWTYSDGTYVAGNAWNGVVTGSKPTFTGSDGGGWNKDVAPGGTASLGFVFAGQDAMNANIPQVTGDICK